MIGLEVLFGTEEPWPSIDPIVAAIVLSLFTVIIIFLLLLRYSYKLKDKQRKAHQLFLFKAKQLGLSNYQFKALRGLVDIIKLKDPNRMFSDEALFERSIGAFLAYLKSAGEGDETVIGICRDIIITHEKIYRPSAFRTPLTTLAEIEPGGLIFLLSEDGGACIAKITAIVEGKLLNRVFWKGEASLPLEGKNVDLYFWRAGDAEYNASVKVVRFKDREIEVAIPESYTRGKEVRLPYVDVMVPCTIRKETPESQPEKEEEKGGSIGGAIYKINENEAVVKLPEKIDYRGLYTLSFTISDFNVKITTKVIADRTIQEQTSMFYTFKFTAASDIARKIIKNYVVKHL